MLISGDLVGWWSVLGFGLWCQLSPFWQLLMGWANSPGMENNVKHDLLRECVETLYAFRARMHEELDAGIAEELDVAIERLESCMKNEDEEVMVEAEVRAGVLKVISEALSAATNIAELI